VCSIVGAAAALSAGTALSAGIGTGEFLPEVRLAAARRPPCVRQADRIRTWKVRLAAALNGQGGSKAGALGKKISRSQSRLVRQPRGGGPAFTLRVPAVAVAVVQQLGALAQNGVAVATAPSPIAQPLQVHARALSHARVRHTLPPRGCASAATPKAIPPFHLVERWDLRGVVGARAGSGALGGRAVVRGGHCLPAFARGSARRGARKRPPARRSLRRWVRHTGAQRGTIQWHAGGNVSRPVPRSSDPIKSQAKAAKG